jgi:CheY-like chemotaxis protein
MLMTQEGLMRKHNAELTAMLIDDSRAIRELLAAMLVNQGISRVLQAEDGVSAFRALESSERPVDLLFCDLAMPGVDGVETLRGLATRHIEAGIVLLSGLDPKLMATVADMAEQLGLRVLGALRKPFSEAQIAAMIERYWRMRQPARRRPSLMVTLEELDEALSEQRIDVYYQPKIRLTDGALSGVEALARMHHRAYGVIEPDSFIPLAEESSSRITRLTLDVLRQAIAQAGA